MLSSKGFGQLGMMLRRRAAVVISLALILLFPVSIEASPSDEYRLKAALLFKLGDFVTWPDSDREPFEICVFGKNPFDGALVALQARKVKDKQIALRFFDRVNANLGQCHILYIPASENMHISSVIMSASYNSVLTISDIQNFAETGGMIELTKKNNRIGFRINLRVVKEAKIKIASPLLELATIVSTE
ncbi:MAG: YfiR family protein [Motiliproteus sp.]